MALYPTSLSLISARAATLDGAGAGEPHSVIHDELEDEIEAIAAELGTSPSGSDATVAARLARIDALVAQSIYGLTLAPGVVSYGAPYMPAPSSSKVALTCTLHGLLHNTSGSTITAGTAIAQVHSTHIPLATETFATLIGNTTPVRVDVEITTGQIRLVGSGWPNTEYLSVSGITYLANT